MVPMYQSFSNLHNFLMPSSLGSLHRQYSAKLAPTHYKGAFSLFAFTIYGKWSDQAYISTHTQCSPTSVGLTLAGLPQLSQHSYSEHFVCIVT